MLYKSANKEAMGQSAPFLCVTYFNFKNDRYVFDEKMNFVGEHLSANLSDL